MAEQREHLPVRPSWRCGACHDEWPCQTMRRTLRRNLTRAALTEYLGRLMVEAARDLPTVHPEVLFARFLRLTRGPRPRAGFQVGVNGTGRRGRR